MSSPAWENGRSSPERLPIVRLRFLLESAEKFGLSSSKLLRQCNLSFSLSDIQVGRVESISQAVLARICELCVLEIRELISPPETKGMSRDDFQLCCHILLASTSLREVIYRTRHFLELCDRRYGWVIIDEGQDYLALSFYLGPVEARWDKFFYVTAFQVFSRFYEWVIGEAIPTRFELEVGRTEEGSLIAGMFGIDVEFAATANRIIIPSSYLDKPVIRDTQDLRELLRSYPFDGAGPKEEATLSARVAGIFREAMAKGRELPTLVQIGRKMGMAETTFRRHLAAEGQTIRSIKDRVRIDVGCKMLASENLHIDQVAEILGFKSSKAFSRAFVSWRGITPTAYRHQLKEESVPNASPIAR